MTKVVVHTRAKVYTNMIDGEVKESHGHEIVKEIQVSQEGLKLLKMDQPELFVEPEAPTERVWRKRPIAELDEEIDWKDWGV